MFERFTPAAKELVVEAEAQCRAMHDRKVRSEHLLLALSVEEGATGDVLRNHGLDIDHLRTRLDELANQAGSDAAGRDDQLLEGLGIDIEAIRQSLDDTFGPGAFDRARHRRQSKEPGASRRGGARKAGFDSHSKRVVELSLREALRLKTKHIGPEHIGLGILLDGQGPDGQGMAYRILSEADAELDDVRSAWEAIALGARAR